MEMGLRCPSDSRTPAYLELQDQSRNSKRRRRKQEQIGNEAFPRQYKHYPRRWFDTCAKTLHVHGGTCIAEHAPVMVPSANSMTNEIHGDRFRHRSLPLYLVHVMQDSLIRPCPPKHGSREAIPMHFLCISTLALHLFLPGFKEETLRT